MGLMFLLREDMPIGFKNNPNYAELPAAVNFLQQYEGREFKTESEFEKELSGFQNYLREYKVPESSDKALRAGLLMEKVENISDVHDIFTRSDDSLAGKCWFGSLGPEAILKKYFQFQKEARTDQIIEDDDSP